MSVLSRDISSGVSITVVVVTAREIALNRECSISSVKSEVVLCILTG